MEIFGDLLKQEFPIDKMIPIAAYNWDDEASMQDNNTSAFNYRSIIATDTLSKHSFGRALDINPKLNPYYAYDGEVYPKGARYDSALPGTLVDGSSAVRTFTERGWQWLGSRERHQDYQHFEKP